MADIFLPMEDQICGHDGHDEMRGREQNAQVVEAMGNRYHIGFNTGSCRLCNLSQDRKVRHLVAQIKLGRLPKKYRRVPDGEKTQDQ